MKHYTMPRPKAEKRCGHCGGGPPFAVSWANGKPYWSSWCKKCKNAYDRAYIQTYRKRHLARIRARQQQWARRRRLTLARAQYAEIPTRRLANLIGRLTCPPDKKWCAYGQHQVLRSGFAPSTATADGLRYTCKACNVIIDRLQNLARKKARRTDATPAP